MNPIALALDGLLAGLLLLALTVGMRLNGRLKTLRESHLGFARSVADLDAAALRAETALADLRRAGEETHDALLNRIETARALAARLDILTVDAKAAVERSETRATSPLGRAASDVVSRPAAPRHAPPQPVGTALKRAEEARRPVPPPRRRPSPEDELFEADEREPVGHDLFRSAAGAHG